MINEAMKECGGALRVIPAETRLTVYRRRPVSTCFCTCLHLFATSRRRSIGSTRDLTRPNKELIKFVEASVLYPKKAKNLISFPEKILKICALEHIYPQIEVWRARSCPEQMVLWILEQV